MKDPKIIEWFNKDRKGQSSGPSQPFDRLLEITGADELMSEPEAEKPALPKPASTAVPAKATTVSNLGTASAAPKAEAKSASAEPPTLPKARGTIASSLNAPRRSIAKTDK